jgi:hypothetical protein
LALLIIITHQNCQQTHFLWWFGWIKRIKSSRISFSMKQPYELWLCFRLCKLFKGLIYLLFFFMFFFTLFQFSCYYLQKMEINKIDSLWFYLLLFMPFFGFIFFVQFAISKTFSLINKSD